MYGPVAGASLTTTSAVVLPNTGSHSILQIVALASLTIGIAILVIISTRLAINKLFA